MHNELEEMGINERGQKMHGTRREGKGKWEYDTIRDAILTCAQKLA